MSLTNNTESINNNESKNTTAEDIKELPKNVIIEIASTTTDYVKLYQILAFSPYAKECIEIIWNRRNALNNKEDKDKIYAGMLLCQFSTKEMLLESLNNYSKDNGSYTYRASFVILNENMDYEVYQLLMLKLKQNNARLTLFDYERNQIELCDFSSCKQRLDDFDSLIDKCESVIIYVEEVAIGSLNENTIVKYINHKFGEKYLKIYYRLLAFKQQNQTLEPNRTFQIK